MSPRIAVHDPTQNHADSGLRMLPQLTKRDAAKLILKPFARLAVKELWPCRKLFSYRGVNSASCSIVNRRLFRNGLS